MEFTKRVILGEARRLACVLFVSVIMFTDFYVDGVLHCWIKRQSKIKERKRSKKHVFKIARQHALVIDEI